MKFCSKGFRTILVAVCILCLLFDPKTALEGMTEGIELCLHSVIPSLMPFIFLSILFSAGLAGLSFSFLKKATAFFGLPPGAEPIFFLGCLGGYPVGAQIIRLQYETDSLSKETARLLLGYCSNAGPSFIFGIVATAFSFSAAPWVLWLVQILSALCVAFAFKSLNSGSVSYIGSNPVSTSEALKKTCSTMAVICGWVLLFRTFLHYLSNWFLSHFPVWLQTILSGSLELTNGCIGLNLIDSECLRFCISAAILSFGGICVAMQTSSVVKDLGMGMYFPGKLLQSIISFLLGLSFYSTFINGDLLLGLIPVLLTLIFIFFVRLLGILRIRTGKLQINAL